MRTRSPHRGHRILLALIVYATTLSTVGCGLQPGAYAVNPSTGQITSVPADLVELCEVRSAAELESIEATIDIFRLLRQQGATRQELISEVLPQADCTGFSNSNQCLRCSQRIIDAAFGL